MVAGIRIVVACALLMSVCATELLAVEARGQTGDGGGTVAYGRGAELGEDESAAESGSSWLLVADQRSPVPVTRAELDQSLALGRKFLLASQLPSGVFRYRVNLVTGEEAPEQGPVRQAGSLWGLALIHQDQPSAETREAVLRGLAFFAANSRRTSDGRRFIRFPGDGEGATGTVGLVVLALVDFLRAEPMDAHASLRQQLDEYLRYLQSLERSDHRFYSQCLLSSGEGAGKPSPYFDGEILLALVKASRYLGREELQPLVLRAAEASHAAYARDAIAQRRDDPNTKGYFQWACLAYLELHESRWTGTDVYAPRAIELAHWMIDVHRVLQRPFNTAYAHEGIIVAHYLAAALGDAASQAAFRRAIESGLSKLLTWQVGSARPAAYLRDHPDYQVSCTGGVLGAENNPWLRIDMTQHQVHAVILARKYVWSQG